MYVETQIYDSFKEAINLASFLSDNNDYKQVEKGENPTFNFPLKTLPQYDPIYVVGYTEDSLLAEVISYYDYGARRGGSFTKGWVYAKCLHKEAPPKAEQEK